MKEEKSKSRLWDETVSILYDMMMKDTSWIEKYEKETGQSPWEKQDTGK